MITIDCREGALLRSLGFESCVASQSPVLVRGVNVNVGNLVLGDVVLTKQSTLVVERKTVSDLVSSIHDGRYREQKQRLLTEYPSTHIVYIIEKFVQPLPQESIKKVFGAILNMQLEHGITVMCSFDINSTADIIFDLYSKLDVKTRKSNGTVGISTLSKSRFSSQFHTENFLMTIKGVSFNLAKTITTLYPSMASLVHAFNEHPADTRHFLLAGLKGIGKVLSKRIYSFLFSSTVD